MELKQKLELRRLLAPELRQSLQVLMLAFGDLQSLIDQEMLDNPILEEAPPDKLADKPLSNTESLEKFLEGLPPAEDDYEKRLPSQAQNEDKTEFAQSLITRKISLQDILLRQLGMFADAQGIRIGQEIIGNIDENGYLKASIEEIAGVLKAEPATVETVLSLIQQFEPAGIGARDIPECLLIQVRMAGHKDPLLEQIIKFHLDDVAKKNHSRISKALDQPLEKVEEAIRIIAKLNPKPGRNYSVDEVQQIIPDVIIEEAEGALRITINNERIPRLVINKAYRAMLKNKNLDEKTREFIAAKLRRAYELVRAVAKRESTLRKVVQTIVELQSEALREDLSYLKPLTFAEVAEKIDMHETTVCRVVMNKYAQTPCGMVALKDFFPSRLRSKDTEGKSVSSEKIKGFIQDMVDGEDTKHPLSDEDIRKLLQEKHALNVARRTVTKYREELKILSSVYRRVK